MKLLNCSIGEVRTIRLGAETLRTAHVKTPIAQPWVVTDDGVAGDQRAVHPDKIYAFARAGYDHWARHLDLDPAAWPDGFFGENLTLDDLDEEDVRVGDVFALGDDVRLIVAGVRNPCVKLTWRLGQPRTFQRIFALSGRTGVYLGVLAPGVVRPGDRLERIHHDPHMPSVSDVCRLINSHGPPPLEPLKRLLAFEGLSKTNRLLLGSKLDAAERAAGQVDGRWAGWRPFVIDRVVEETPEIRSVHLRPADGGALSRPRPGQFVSVRMQDAQGAVHQRSWSLSAFTREPDSYRLTVRRQAGPGSNWLHRAQAGARVDLRAPSGNFTLDLGTFRPVVMIAAGIGITPLLAMLQAHLGRTRPPPVHLIYGARTPAEAAFRGELDALAAASPGFHLTYVYSRSGEGGRPPGRITADLVAELLGDLHVVVEGHRVHLPWYEGETYICGPDAFAQALASEIVARGGNPDQVFLERFHAAEAEACELEQAEVRFARSGASRTWRLDSGLNLLELAEQAGVEVESDCRAGACLSCMTRVLDGATTADTGDGSALLCLGRPKSASLVLDI